MKILWGLSRYFCAMRQMHRLFLQEKKGLVAVYYFVVFIASCLPFLQSFVLGVLTNYLLSGNATYVLILSCVYGFVLAFFDFTVDAQAYLSRLFWLYYDRQTGFLLAKKLASLDLATIEDSGFQNKKTKTDENRYRAQSFVDRQYYITQNLLELCFAVFTLAWAQWWLVLIMFMAIIPNFLVIKKTALLEWGIWGDKSDLRRWYATIISYFYNKHALLEMILTNSTGPMLTRAYYYFDIFSRKTQEILRRSFFQQGFASIAQFAGYTISFIMIGRSVLSGEINIGTFVFLVGSMATLRSALGGFAFNIAKQYDDGLHVQDMIDFFAIEPRIRSGHIIPRTLKNNPPRIEFCNVSFQYRSSSQSVLHDVNLVIDPGQKIALVGLNGAGKSTFIKLLCRFYDPTQGQILVNGEDLRTLDLGYWHAQLATIFQEYPRYQLTASDAIAMGRGLEVDTGKIKKAAIAAEADEFIRTWKPGYDQILSVDFDGGIDPSLGQWQRIAVARALYRDAPILILDEPTSSVDAQAEQKIFDMLSGLPRSKTVILISHRFSTVRHADKIVVLDGGTIAEQGTHDELMRLGGTYARLFALQAKGYTMT